MPPHAESHAVHIRPHHLCFAGLIALACGCIAEEPVASRETAVSEDVEEVSEAPRAVPSIDWSAWESAAPVDETEACSAISDAYRFHGLDIGCPTTIEVCPDLFRDAFGVACMKYDAASVAACVANITAAETCDALHAAECDVAPVWGTEPTGCAP